MPTNILIDASSLKHTVCFLKFWRTVIEGYSPKVNSIQIEFGSAVHQFRKVFRVGGLPAIAESVNAARDYLKNTVYSISNKKKLYLTDESYLVNVCQAYASKYAVDNLTTISDPVPLVEKKFALPYKTIGDYRFILTGTWDEIATLKGGLNCIVDAKTSSRWDHEEYLREYYLSGQMAFYTLVAKLYAKRFPSSFMGKIASGDLGIIIDAIFLNGKDSIEFMRSHVFIFKQDTLDEYQTMLNEVIERTAIQLAECGTYTCRDGLLNGACFPYGQKCHFFNVCIAPDNRCREVTLERDFVKKTYNPLKFGEKIE